MRAMILTAVLVVNLSGRLCAQTDLNPGAGAFGLRLAGQSLAIPVPAPVSVVHRGAAGTDAQGAPGPAGKKKPEMVCKLTGVDSRNYSGTNAQVKGTDLGSIFEHKGKTYFLFGDTNIRDPIPANHLSNLLAYSSDQDASDCIDLHYFTMRDLFTDAADFYARESDLQAEEEIKEAYDIDKDIAANYQAHYDWARAAGFPAAENEILRKAGRIFNYYAAIKNDRPALADYYARLSVRLANFGLSFADDIAKPSSRNSASYQGHYNWALAASLNDINKELRLKYDRLFAGVEQVWVKQIFASKTFPEEFTDIPTNGISINGRIYIHFMSVKQWDPRSYKVNYAGIAYSDDDGKTFTRVDNLFPANSNFIQVAMVNDGGYLYLFGIPADRWGGVKLARVEESKVLDKSSYQFCKLVSGKPAWVNSEAEADLIVQAPVGELSVQWNSFLNSWLMLYLNDGNPDVTKKRIEARTASDLWGPWGEAQVVVSPPDLPASVGLHSIYGPFMHPLFTEGNGETVYFLMSLWGPYNVFLMKTTLN